MRIIAFHAQGWEDFTGWAQQDLKLFARLVRLISDTAKVWLRSPTGVASQS